MPEFDKNAAYIWACFGIGALLMLGATLQAILAARAAKRRLANLEAATNSEPSE